MPYVNDATRDDVDYGLKTYGVSFIPNNAGELNYLTSELVDNFLNEHGFNYANINEMIGFLECCKLELYRVLVSPYEEEKIKENGPVYNYADLRGTTKTY